MENKVFGVLGLGKFGMSVARELSGMDYDVIAVDNDEEIIKEMAQEVSYAVSADITDIDAMREIGIGDADAVFVAISEDLESSIMAAMVAKELGAGYVIAKASGRMHGKVLERVGVDRVVYPEIEMGRRLARNVVAGNFLDMIDLSSDYALVEITVPGDWVGKSILQLNVRQSYGVNIVAMKHSGEIIINLDPGHLFEPDDVLIVIGSNDAISRLGE